MNTTNLNEQVTKQAMDTIELAEQQLSVQGEVKKAENLLQATTVEEQTAANETVLKDDPSVGRSFEGLPIESLICGPIVAAAKGQQELTSVYVDTVMKLAYKDGKADGETNVLKMKMDRPVTTNDGNVEMESCTIEAPLLALVPVPAFIMDELTVDFNMEVKTSELKQDETKSDVSSQVNFKSWYGLNANITGSVSSDSLHKRQTDNSATYNIHARAIQQPPSEGMAKLTSLFSQMMEPIPTKDIK